MENEERIEQGANDAESQQEEKRFTQTEVDALISKRLARALKNVPDDKELAEFRTWKSNHAEERRDETDDRLNAELKAAKEAAEQLKRDNYILTKGVTGDEAEFLAFKAAKMVDKTTTFEQAVDQLVTERKKATFDWTGKVGQNGDPAERNASLMNQLIRNAFKN